MLHTFVQLIVVEHVIVLAAVQHRAGRLGRCDGLVVRGVDLEDAPHMQIAAGGLAMRLGLVQVLLGNAERRRRLTGGLLAQPDW